MKRLIISFLIFVGLIISAIGFNVYNNSPRVIINRVFKDTVVFPQKLTYRIYAFGLFPIVDAILYPPTPERINDGEVYHLMGQAKTTLLISAFLKGQVVLDSYIDRNTYLPVLFKQNVDLLGKFTQEKEVTYDQKLGMMIVNGVKRQILPNTYDPLSLMLNLRRIDFLSIKEFEMYLNTNKKNYVFKGSAANKEIAINNRRYELEFLRAKIFRKDKNPYHKTNISGLFIKTSGWEGLVPIWIKIFSAGYYMVVRLSAVS